MEHAIAGQYLAGGDRRLGREPLVDRQEIRTRRVDQLVEAVDDEVRLLVRVDPITRAHDALEIEADAVRRRRLEAMDRFALRAHDARTVDAKSVVLADQAELDRVPVKA